MDRTTMRVMRDRLMRTLVKHYPMEIPDTHFDGTPITDVKDVAAVLGISTTEAAARMDHKDVFTGMAGMQMVNGLSGGRPSQREPVVQRAFRITKYGSKPIVVKKKRKPRKIPSS